MVKRKVDWVTYDKPEVEKIISKLAKEGHTNAKIGVILRDQYGIPSVRHFGVKMSKLSPKKEIPEDLFNLLVRAVQVHKHLSANKKDAKAKHGFEAIESRVRRLSKYYIRKGLLSKGWKYTIEKAKLLVK